MVHSPRGITQIEAIRGFTRAGWQEIPRRGKGSHRVLVKPGMPPLVIPHGILKVGLLKGLIKRAGLTEEEFKELL